VHSSMKIPIFVLSLISLVSAEIKSQCVQRGMLAMTWNDGPSANTRALLNHLNDKKVRVTFHVTTKYLTDPKIQAMIQQIASSGHLIGLRTESDWNLLDMSDEQITAGIARQANVLQSFIGYFPKMICLPYEGYNARVLRAVESTGMVVTNFNLESFDYSGNANSILEAFKLNLSLKGKGGGSFISVQHDGVQQSVAITPKIIDYVKSMGYKFVTLDECMGLGDMTKNKDAVKGGDDSVDLGPMGDMPSSGGMVSGQPGEGAESLPDADMGKQGANKRNSAASLTTASSLTAVLIASICALLL